MKVISVNVGKPQKYTLDDVTIATSMVRHSVPEIQINKLRVEGDEFANPEFHGEVDAVVYALSADRYPEWEKFLNKPFPLASLGDEYQVGTAVLRATGPRYPCNKLNYSSGDELKLVKRVQDKVTVLDLYQAMRAKKKGQRDDAKSEVILACSQLHEKYRKRV